MVEVKFVDGTEDSYETPAGCKKRFKYRFFKRCFEIKDIDGKVLIPVEFIKSIRHIEV